MILTLLFVILFYIFIFVVGVIVSQKTQSNCQSMILADRSLPTWIGILTMTATWVGGGYILGTSEAVYSYGLLWAQAPWGYAISLIIGGLFFAEKMRKANYTTMLDPFYKKYGYKVTAFLFIPAFIGELCWSAAILTALGVTCSILFDLNLSVAIIVSSMIAIAYTYMGGMKSVSYTDAIQLILIMIGLLICLPFLFKYSGGVTSLVSRYYKLKAEAAWPIPTNKSSFSWFWLDSALLLMLGGIPWGVYFQRVLSSKSPSNAKKVSLYAALGCLIFAISPIIIGMVAATTNWELLNIPTPSPTNALTTVIKYLTPAWVAMIVLAAISAAVMSSVDSSILSVASMFTWNIYKPFYGAKSIFKVDQMIRIAIICFGLTATFLAIYVKSVYTLWVLCSDLVYVILFPQLLAIFYFKQHSKQAAIIAIILGLIFRLSGGEPALNINPIIMQWSPTTFPIKTFAMLISLSCLYLLPKLERLNHWRKRAKSGTLISNHQEYTAKPLKAR